MKQRLDKQAIAIRAAKELPDGAYVNLGAGIPTLVANLIPEGRSITFHSENGMLWSGPEDVEGDIYHLPVGYAPVRPDPGVCFFDVAASYVMIRGGHLITILGGLQVSEEGDLANWKVPNSNRPGRIGGAMDLAANSKRVIICMEHTTRSGECKIVKRCHYPLTAKKSVNLVVTDMAVIEVTPTGMLLREVAPGFTPEDIQAVTEPHLQIAEDLKEIEL